MKIKVDIPAEVQKVLDKDKVWLTPADVADCLHVSQEIVRQSAKAERLDFPYVWMGTRLKIPKIPFLRWLGYDIEIIDGRTI